MPKPGLGFGFLLILGGGGTHPGPLFAPNNTREEAGEGQEAYIRGVPGRAGPTGFEVPALLTHRCLWGRNEYPCFTREESQTQVD